MTKRCPLRSAERASDMIAHLVATPVEAILLVPNQRGEGRLAAETESRDSTRKLEVVAESSAVLRPQITKPARCVARRTLKQRLTMPFIFGEKLQLIFGG